MGVRRSSLAEAWSFHERGNGVGGFVAFQADSFLGEGLDLEGPVICCVPVWMALDLASFRFSCKHDDHTDILLPDNTPKVLEEVSVSSFKRKGLY